MNIGIIGCRARDTEADYLLTKKAFADLIERLLALNLLASSIVIVSGGCPQGGDRFAVKLARVTGFPILTYYPMTPEGARLSAPDFGKANYERDLLIAHDSQYLIACVHPERGKLKGQGRGTEHTIKAFVDKPGHHPSSLILVFPKD